jgi:hypothetical protein
MSQPEVITVDVPWDGVRPGDDLTFLSSVHRITRVEPYSHPVVTRGATWAIACADTQQRCYRAAWGITLSPGSHYEVTRRAPVLTGPQRAVLGFLAASGEDLLAFRDEESLAVTAELRLAGLAVGSPEHGYRITDAGVQVLR